MKFINLLSLFFLVLTGCNIDGELAECPYNVKLEYWYTTNSMQNELPFYIYTFREYLFDEHGLLCDIINRSAKMSTTSTFSLPPGKYTLLTWANIDSLSQANKIEIGKTYLSEMCLLTDTKADTEPLFYGYHPFTVESIGITRSRIDLLHCHLKLGVTVKWKEIPPVNSRNFRMTLSGLSPIYSFQPEYMEKNQAGKNVHIPGRPDKVTKVRHETIAKMDISHEINGCFVTYRLHNDDHPIFCLWAADKAIMREIDLYKYFHTMHIDLDYNLCQEFNLLMEIDKDGNVNVSAAISGDWIDGGTIGTES